MADAIIIRTPTGSKIIRPGENRIVGNRIVNYEKELARIRRSSKSSKSSNTSDNKKTDIPEPSQDLQSVQLEVSQTSQQTKPTNNLNPNIEQQQQFQTRLVTQAPQGTVFDGGVNQGTQQLNYIPQYNLFVKPPQTTISATFEKTYNPKGFSALRVDKYFNDLYERSNYKAINRQPDSSFVASQINPLEAGKSIIAGAGRALTYPIYNPDKVVVGTIEALQNPEASAKAFVSEAQKNPFGTFGEVVVGTKGVEYLSKGIVKAKDYSRTIGRTELPRTQVTTPEVITGEQTFPYKSQTPEQLASEFYGRSEQVSNVQELFGKDKPTGFSASPDPLKSNKVLSRAEIGDFTSASSGLYQAPSLSEWFLKIRMGESSQYSIFPNIKGKPTINIIKSSEVKTFPENVVAKARQSSNPVEYLNKYAEANFKQGESFVSPEFTLGKPESEILLKSGTEFTPVQSVSGEKYFVNIEGRRVPVTAYEPLSQQNIFNVGNTKTSAQISQEFAQTSRSLTTSASNPNFLSDFVKSSLINPYKSSNSGSIITTGNLPSSSSPFSEITSSTAFNPGRISPYIEISGVIKPSSSIPPVTQNPSRISPTYDLEPVVYPITPSPEPVISPSPRRRTTTPKPPKPSDFIIPPSENVGGGTSNPPSIIITPSRIVTPPPSSPRIPNIYETPRTLTNPFNFVKQRQKRTQAFDVYVRRQGKFFKENINPLTKQSAINFGTYTVSKDSSATFKIKSVFGKPTTFLQSGNIQNFYKKGNLFIEKKEKRIKRSSPLELQQITFKGIATNKARSKKLKKLFGGGL